MTMLGGGLAYLSTITNEAGKVVVAQKWASTPETLATRQFISLFRCWNSGRS